MNRRDWLRRAGLIAAGIVAADQLEILERLAHVRKSFAVDGVRDRLQRYDMWVSHDGIIHWMRPDAILNHAFIGYITIDRRTHFAVEWSASLPLVAGLLS